MSSYFAYKNNAQNQSQSGLAQQFRNQRARQNSQQRNQESQRFKQADYDYKCEWDVPKYFDLAKDYSPPKLTQTIYDQEENIAMMPDFGFFGKIKQRFHEKQLKMLQHAIEDRNEKLSLTSSNPLVLADISKENIERRSTTRESGPAVDKTEETIEAGEENDQNIENSKTLWPQILTKKYEDPFEDWFKEHHDFKIEKTPSPMKKNFTMQNKRTASAFKQIAQGAQKPLNQTKSQQQIQAASSGQGQPLQSGFKSRNLLNGAAGGTAANATNRNFKKIVRQVNNNGQQAQNLSFKQKIKPSQNNVLNSTHTSGMELGMPQKYLGGKKPTTPMQAQIKPHIFGTGQKVKFGVNSTLNQSKQGLLNNSQASNKGGFLKKRNADQAGINKPMLGAGNFNQNLQQAKKFKIEGGFKAKPPGGAPLNFIERNKKIIQDIQNNKKEKMMKSQKDQSNMNNVGISNFGLSQAGKAGNIGNQKSLKQCDKENIAAENPTAIRPVVISDDLIEEVEDNVLAKLDGEQTDLHQKTNESDQLNKCFKVLSIEQDKKQQNDGLSHHNKADVPAAPTAVLGQIVPAGTNGVAKKNFLYEPAMFPNRMIKQITGGIPWHNLSPTAKQRVNEQLQTQQKRDQNKLTGSSSGHLNLVSLSITNQNFYGSKK